MDLSKLMHDLYDSSRHWHFSLFVGFIASVRLFSKKELPENKIGYGEVPGDNILPKKIVDSLFSRRR